MVTGAMGHTDFLRDSRAGRNGFGFWAVAFAFASVMAFTTAPTPLWSLYARRDGFSSLTVTIVFAVYALAVALSLFLVGHLSDWHGRRRVLIPALALQLLAAGVFIAWPSLPGLLCARVLSGLGIGAVTATAAAWLTDLGGADHRRAPLVATGANLGGLGAGGLIAGGLAQWPDTRCACPTRSSSRCWRWPSWRSWPHPTRAPGRRRDPPIALSASRCPPRRAGASSPPRWAPRSPSRYSGC
jgi:MFS family permease